MSHTNRWDTLINTLAVVIVCTLLFWFWIASVALAVKVATGLGWLP